MNALVADELYRFFHSETEEVFALRGVSMSVDEGEFVAVLGPSGSGKSTLLACLAGLDDPDGGRVLVGSRPISHQAEAVRAALRARLVGFVAQERNLIEHLTVKENAVLALRLAGMRPAGRIQRTLDSLGIGEAAPVLPSRLSGGEAVRAALAVALVTEPVVLVADEPTAELDSSSERAVAAQLKRVAEGGTAVVAATHSELLASHAARVVVLQDGRLQHG